MTNRFDWPAMMRAGLGHLRLRPDEFWHLTPAELAVMLGLENGGARALTRAGLDELSARFPDATGEQEER